MHYALTWFGEADPTSGSPWDKAERLAELVAKKRSLLVLDGLESLQSALDVEHGRLRDPAMAVFLTRLAQRNDGLCVITTQTSVLDLSVYHDSVIEVQVEQISPAAGRALLRTGGVLGTDEELEAAAKVFGCHALALQLLAAYLRQIPGHHVSKASQIPQVNLEIEAGRHPRRILDAFEHLLGEGPELDVMRMLGLFVSVRQSTRR
jgi:hypothetical protein